MTRARDIIELVEQIGGRSLEGLSKSELAKYPKVGDTFSLMGMKVVVVDAEDPTEGDAFFTKVTLKPVNPEDGSTEHTMSYMDFFGNLGNRIKLV